jgi:hypothetical protein
MLVRRLNNPLLVFSAYPRKIPLYDGVAASDEVQGVEITSFNADFRNRILTPLR